MKNLFFLLIFPAFLNAQVDFYKIQPRTKITYNLERITPQMALQFGAGFFGGIGDQLQFHYYDSVFPQKGGEKFLWGGRQYWDPQLSWRNKYNSFPEDRSEAFPLSKSALVWVTDGWHLSNSLERTAHRFTIITYVQPEGPRKFWKKAIDFTLLTLSYSAGHIAAEALTTKN